MTWLKAAGGVLVWCWEIGWYVPAWLVARAWQCIRAGWRDGNDPP